MTAATPRRPVCARTAGRTPNGAAPRVLGAVAAMAAAALTGCAGPAAGHGAATARHDPGPEKGSAAAGELRVDGAWVPESSMPDMSTAYLRISNDSAEDDRLTAAETSVSADTDLCSTPTTESGAARMQTVEEIPVPGRGSTELRSGGFHLMLNDIADPLAVGDTVTVTLTFAGGTTVDVEAPVLERTAGGGSDTGSDHSGHH